MNELDNRQDFFEIFKKCWDPSINIKDKRKEHKVLPVRIYFEGNKRVQRGVVIENNKTLKTALNEVFGFEDYTSLRVNRLSIH